jgi:GDPmannose 4,6-dehydratase
MNQSETTPFQPRSPYAAAKIYAYWITVNYREAFDLHASNGILFNHESPRRGETFVTRKITMGLGRILAGKQQSLYLGNLDSRRDWGHAKDYVEAMWAMMQLDEPHDLVIGTGEQHSVREFVEESCKVLGVSLAWSGEGINEVGIDRASGREIIRVDPRYFRPTEVDSLHCDASKARKLLNWAPTISFHQLVEEMAIYDFKLAQQV